jgi:eukaryotic-like serine/threonine-protein kinase
MAAATGVQNPHRFGRYVLIDRLGKGGMAEVFRAIMPGVEGFRRDLVIKQIRPDQSRARNFIEMFVHEARISALLHHPNIVQVFDFGQVDGCYFLAMELLRGRDLLGVMKALRERRRPFPIPIAIHIAQQVALGLAYAHGLTSPEGKPLDILHRDVSPSNIMCLSTGGVKLLDFGIASAIGEGDTAESEESTFKGKLSYMAPERLGLGLGGAGAGGIDGAVGERLEPKLDGRIDVFSLGTVLWEVLAGRRLFQGKTDADKLRAVLEKPIPPPSSLRGDIPPRLDEIVLKALERDRDKRYLTGQSLADDLEDLAMDTKYQSRMLPMLLQDLFGVGGSGTHLAISALPAELLCPPVVLSAAASATAFTGAGAGARVAPLALAGVVAPASVPTVEARAPSPIDEAVPAAVSMNVSAAEMSGPPTPMPPSAERAAPGAAWTGEVAPIARSSPVESPGVAAVTRAPGEAELPVLAWRWPPSFPAPRLLVAGAAIGLAVALTGFGLNAVFSRSSAVAPTIGRAHGTAAATGPVPHPGGAGPAGWTASGAPATPVPAPEPEPSRAGLATLAARPQVEAASAPAEIVPVMSSVSPALGTVAPAPLAMATVMPSALGSIGRPPGDSARQPRPGPSKPAPTVPSPNRSASARPPAPRAARQVAAVPSRPPGGHQPVAHPAPAHPAPPHPVGNTLAAFGSTSPGTSVGQAVPKTDGRVEKGLSIDPFAEAASRLTRRAQ